MTADPSDADVVVVGAGLGGLCVAAYLAVAGRRVVVVDRHAVAGGNGTVFTHHGFEFDVGLHYIGDCGPGGGIPSALEPLGIELTFREMDRDGFDTFLFADGTSFRVPAGVERFRLRLHDAFPTEGPAIDAYVDTIAAIDAELTGGGPGPTVIANLSTTLGQCFDEHRMSPRLRTVLGGQHGTYALPPSRASLILHAGLAMHYLKGAYYPEGGGQVIADRLAEVVRSNGGRIFLQTPVEHILVERGAVAGVQLHVPSALRAQGVPEVVRAPTVVSDADLKHTVLDMVGAQHLPEDYVALVSHLEMALPLFVLYLVIDRDLVAEGVPNTNFWVLGDDVEEEYAALEAGRMVDRPMTYVTSASLKDPTNPRLCRPGQTNLQIMTLVPREHEWWGLHGGGPAAGERYRRNVDYRRRKRDVRDRLLEVAEDALPGLRDHIVYEECATPITHERFVRSTGGTSYGIACTPEQFGLNRPSYVTPLDGLHLVGASTISAHGVGGVLAGGVSCASSLLGRSARVAARERRDAAAARP
jgi:all-trans-retinol 13,14-reductase